jgi:methyl-accepting chemotaxis protein
VSDSTKELIERIGAYVPAEFRAAFYREMLYCRSLPENDEMLRILRVLQILTLLIEQVPDRIVKERERLDKLMTGTARQFDQSLKAGAESLAQLDRRLAQLPGLIVADISPKNIVSEINANLQNELARSTLPQTEEALREAAAKIRKVCSEFGDAADSLGDSHRGAAEQARRATTDMYQRIADAAHSANQSAENLTRSFNRQYWWSVLFLTLVALVLGFAAGIMFMR